MTRKLAKSGSVELSYSVEGSGPETVLLIMGLGGRAADWASIFPAALATRYRVVRFDNRGIGGSFPPARGFTLPRIAPHPGGGPRPARARAPPPPAYPDGGPV